MTVEFNEILREIEKLSVKQPEGFTIQEMADAVDHAPDWCRREMRKLILAGKAKNNGNAMRPRIDGQMGRVPVYLFVK